MNTVSLLELYKAEKATIIDPLYGNVESFPSFKQWKAEIDQDHQQNFVTVTVDEADRLMDSLVDEAEQELNNETLFSNTDIEERDMSTEENVKSETVETTEVVDAAAKPKRKRSVEKKAEVNKMTAARRIYASMSRGKTVNRAKIIEKFMSDVGLTKAGAATYYQKLKTEKVSTKKAS